jgi:TetR/AcrR family transcriptional regulator, regulator of biofilm formation and stress response
MAERQARGERRRAEILGAALQVIGERGIDAVTHRAVADVAGMRAGLTTYYFPTIDGLLEAALEQFVADEVQRLRAAQEEIEGEDATPQEITERLSAVLNDNDAWAVAQFGLYLEAARRPSLRAAAERCLEAYRGVMEAALRAAGSPRPQEGAGVFLALTDGLGLHSLATTGKTAPAEELVPLVLELFRAYAPAADV